MEQWQKRYAKRKGEVFLQIKEKLEKSAKPEYIRQEVWQDVVYQTAKKLSHKYMTKIRQGERA